MTDRLTNRALWLADRLNSPASPGLEPMDEVLARLPLSRERYAYTVIVRSWYDIPIIAHRPTWRDGDGDLSPYCGALPAGRGSMLHPALVAPYGRTCRRCVWPDDIVEQVEMEIDLKIGTSR